MITLWRKVSLVPRVVRQADAHHAVHECRRWHGPGGRKKLQRPSWDDAPAAAVQWVRRSRRLTTAARLVTTALGIVLQRVVTAFPACFSILRGRLFRVHLDNGHDVLGYLGGRMKRYRIRVMLGDRVRIELSPYDLTRGRIVYRLG